MSAADPGRVGKSRDRSIRSLHPSIPSLHRTTQSLPRRAEVFPTKKTAPHRTGKSRCRMGTSRPRVTRGPPRGRPLPPGGRRSVRSSPRNAPREEKTPGRGEAILLRTDGSRRRLGTILRRREQRRTCGGEGRRRDVRCQGGAGRSLRRAALILRRGEPLRFGGEPTRARRLPGWHCDTWMRVSPLLRARERGSCSHAPGAEVSFASCRPCPRRRKRARSRTRSATLLGSEMRPRVGQACRIRPAGCAAV
jgi:hypothetical protein